MLPQELIRRPLITEKATQLKEASNTICFEVAKTANKIEVRRAVEKLFGVKVLDVRVANRGGQVEAHGPVRRPAKGLEEGLRPARAGSDDRVLRGRVMAVKKFKPTSPGVRFQTKLDFQEISPVRPEKRLYGRAALDRRPQQPGPDDVPLHGRRPQAALPDDRLPARQAGHPGQGRHDRVRPEPHGADRAAPLRRRREALHPGAQRARRSAPRWSSGPEADILPGNALPLQAIPLGTTIHNIELTRGKGGQLVALRRRRGAADGQGGRLRPGAVCPRARCAKSTSSATRRSGRSATSSTRTSRSARPAAIAGWAGVRTTAASSMNPVDHPMGGGEGKTSGGRHPTSPWGWKTKGMKTRNNKRTDGFIVRRRKSKAVSDDTFDQERGRSSTPTSRRRWRL